MKQSDYEQLLEQGYTEEELKVIIDGLTKMTLTPEALGPNRNDRKNVVTTKEGVSKKVSSVFEGKKNKGINLPNGDYVSYEEFLEKLNEELSTSSPDVVFVSKKTGKKVDTKDIIETVREATHDPYLIVGDKEVINGKEVPKLKVKSDKTGIELSKGMILGAQKIQLPSGDYVSFDEIKKAMESYLKLTPGEKEEPIVEPIEPKDPEPEEKEPEEPKIEPSEPEPNVKPNDPDDLEPITPILVDGEEEPEIIITEPGLEPVAGVTEQKKEEEKYKVIKRIRQKLAMLPLIIGATATILSGITVEKQYTNVTTQTDRLDYSITQTLEREEPVFETEDEVARRIDSSIVIGEGATVEDGVKYHESSDYKYGGANKSGTFGSKIRPSGEYEVDRLSFIHDGKIEKVVAEDGVNLAEAKEQVASSLGVDESELEVYASMESPTAGWVNVDELNADIDKTPQITGTKVVTEDGKTYSGTINDFEGDSVKLTSGEEVQLIEDGTPLKSGTIVQGSTGGTYRVDKVEEEVETHTEKVEDGEKLTYDASKVNPAYAAAGLAAAALFSKKKKEMTELTQEELDDVVKEAQEKFESESEFSKAVDKITTVSTSLTPAERVEKALIDQKTTLEDVQKMGGMKK